MWIVNYLGGICNLLGWRWLFLYDPLKKSKKIRILHVFTRSLNLWVNILDGWMGDLGELKIKLKYRYKSLHVIKHIKQKIIFKLIFLITCNDL